MHTPSAGSSPRQTLSYLRNLFDQYGIQPKNKLGQNFLIDLNVLEVMVRAAELSRQDLALEVGTGSGSLTSRLADAASAVLSVEIDPDFHTLAQEVLRNRDNVVLIHSDILKNKNLLHPRVMSALEEVRQRFSLERIKLAANLPYVVATPVITNFLLSDVPIERMVVMVQAEIADRLLAVPGTKDYGALTVLVQSLADVEPVRQRLPPAVFWPRPKVMSSIVCIRPNAAKRAIVGDVQRFRHFLRDLYVHRRKNLRGALIGLPSGRRSKEEVDCKLAELQLEPTIRAEALDLTQHLRLSEAFSIAPE